MGCYFRKSGKAGPFRLDFSRLGLGACLAAGLLGSCLAGAPALAQAAPPCRFELGFAALHDLIPAQVGDCVDDEAHNPANGDAVQHTTKGLLVWRKADNWTAFTDGYHTWVNGPYGIQERLNTQRFAWEANPTGLPVMGASGATPAGASPTPTSTPSSPGWQSLSKKYLVSYPSLSAALAALPGYHLHRPC